MNLKGIGVLMLVVVLTILLHSCGDDYTESGIEGQWQLQEIVFKDGAVAKVDTIYYSFKKNVFRYLKLTTPTTSFYCFGNSSISGDELKIDISRDSYEPRDMDEGLDWESLSRTFIIKKHSSSVLELEYSGDVYKLRKY